MIRPRRPVKHAQPARECQDPSPSTAQPDSTTEHNSTLSGLSYQSGSGADRLVGISGFAEIRFPSAALQLPSLPLSPNLWMSQQSTAAKPSLQGVRIKARKGAVKAHAKHEPTGQSSRRQCDHPLTRSTVFRDQLYKHLETVPEGDFDAFTTKLVQAGSTLDFLKYADALFELLLVGGLIQPGGSYVDDGAPVSPFTIFNAKEPPDVEDLKRYIEVLNKLIRRWCAHTPAHIVL